VIYREGLKREDINKEPFSFKVSTVTLVGNQELQKPKNSTKVLSVPGILNNLIQYKAQCYSNQKDLMSQI
jgi:hypothetical protein